MPDDNTGGWFKVPRELRRGHQARMGKTTWAVLCALLDHAGDSGEMFPGRDKIATECGVSEPTVSQSRKWLIDDGILSYLGGGFGRSNAIGYCLAEPREWGKGVTELSLLKGYSSYPFGEKGVNPSAERGKSVDPPPYPPIGKNETKREKRAPASVNPRKQLLAALKEFQVPQAARALGIDVHLLGAWVEAVVGQCHDELKFREYYTAQRFQAFFTSLRGKDAGVVAATLNDQLEAIAGNVAFAQPFARATETIKAGGPTVRTGHMRTRRDEPALPSPLMPRVVNS